MLDEPAPVKKTERKTENRWRDSCKIDMESVGVKGSKVQNKVE